MIHMVRNIVMNSLGRRKEGGGAALADWVCSNPC